jgi:hypothetical protein
MYLNKIWSQGQLFAFSGLDGETSYKNDFTGILAEYSAKKNKSVPGQERF